MKKIFLATVICYAFTACTKTSDVIKPEAVSQQASSSATQNAITLPKRGDSTLYISDASYIQPGSIIELKGWYKSILIRNLQGTAANPITFINKGQVTVGGYASYTMIMQGKYFKITGSGEAGMQYGIHLSSFNSEYYAFGISLGNSSNVEITNVEIDHQHAGVIQNPTSGFAMVDCYYHDNYIHDLDFPEAGGRSECFYLGNTSSSTLFGASYKFVNCRIENNLIEQVSGDGIQVTNGTFTIKGNTIRNFGLAQLADQRNGILIGGNAGGKIINNVIDGGRGDALMIMGVGSIIVKNNTFKNIDVSNLTSQDIVYINARVNVTEGAPLLSIDFSNNYIQGKTNRYALADMTPLLLTLGGTFTANTIEGSSLKSYVLNSKDKWVP